MNKPIEELSVVMPAYNEQEVLPLVLEEAIAALEDLCDRWELIFVDDGSTDQTPALLARAADQEPRIRVLTQPRNLGYSKALIRGFSSSSFKAVFYTDADAQFDLRDIVKLYPALTEFEMVVGYRLDRQDFWIRRLTSRTYNLLQGWILGIRVRDVNCAFKLFRRSFFERVRLSSDGFLIDAELFARAQRAGLTWSEVGIPHRPRRLGSSTVKPSTVVATLRQLRDLKRQLADEASGGCSSSDRGSDP